MTPLYIYYLGCILVCVVVRPVEWVWTWCRRPCVLSTIPREPSCSSRCVAAYDKSFSVDPKVVGLERTRVGAVGMAVWRKMAPTVSKRTLQTTQSVPTLRLRQAGATVCAAWLGRRRVADALLQTARCCTSHHNAIALVAYNDGLIVLSSNDNCSIVSEQSTQCCCLCIHVLSTPLWAFLVQVFLAVERGNNPPHSGRA